MTLFQYRPSKGDKAVKLDNSNTLESPSSAPITLGVETVSLLALRVALQKEGFLRERVGEEVKEIPLEGKRVVFHGDELEERGKV